MHRTNRYLTLAIFFVLLLASFSSVAPCEKLESGAAVQRSELDENRFITYSRGLSAEGQHVAVKWHILRPGTETGPETLKGERLYYIASGSCRAMAGGRFIQLAEKDIFRLGTGAVAIFEAGNATAEVIEIHWPGSSQPETPMFPESMPMNIAYLQYLMPSEGLLIRLVQGVSGQAAFSRLLPGAAVENDMLAAEQILIVERGTMSADIGGKQSELSAGSHVRIASGTQFSLTADTYGCDYIAVLSEARRDYTSALEDRISSFHTILPMFQKAELVVDGRYGNPKLGFTEGPNWLGGKFYFTDQRYGGIYTVSADGSLATVNDDITPCGTALMPNGDLAVCDIKGKRLVEVGPDGKERGILTEKFEGAAYPGIPNDVVSDSKGGLYYTVMSFAEPPGGNVLFYRSPDGRVTRVTEPGDFGIPNGCVLSPDGSLLYVNDDKSDLVWVFDVNGDGSLANKRPFAELIIHDSVLGNERSKSFADGMTVDSEGNLYVCASGFIQIFDNSGSYRGNISCPKPTFHCAFGGEDGSTLFICCMNQIYKIQTKMKGVGF